MNSQINDWTSRQEIASKISGLRQQGKISEAIGLCEQAGKIFPNDYFYPKIIGDLYFKVENYEAASKAFYEFLQKVTPGIVLFNDFAKRYYRLKRVWPQKQISEYAAFLMSEIQLGRIEQTTAARCIDLIKSDLSSEIELSPDGQHLIDVLSSDEYFNQFVNQARNLESSNPAELLYILDRYILNRERTAKTARIDAHCISIYEKLEKYESALKLAEEYLVLRQDSEIIRTFFRICRKMRTYGRVESLLSKYPEILKRSDFNVLYELVYYFEAQNNFEQVQATLVRIERGFKESMPIQKTVKNFYVRFGLLDDVARVDTNISELYASSGKITADSRFLTEVKESEAEIGSKIKELYSQLEHQKQLTAISDLTTGISHELGQPITNIRYTVQFYRRLFEKSFEKEIVFNVFDSILEETERMGGLIKRLAPLTSSRSTVDTFDIVDRIQKRVKAESMRYQKPPINVKVSPETPVYLVGDPVKFDQLVSNLLLNSIDAIKERKRPGYNLIDIRIEETNSEVNIAFTDTGAGVSAKNRGKIFDPFFSTKPPGKGEGLGLFIVWNLLKMQGGKIRLDPNYNKGARFLITIPKEAPGKQ